MLCLRAKKFVTHIRASAKRTEIFNNIQEELLREAGAQDVEVEEADEWPGEVSTFEEPTRVLRLVTWVDTRWNSEYYLIER